MKNSTYRTLLIAYLGFIALGMTGGALGVAWPSMRDTFGLPLDAVAVLQFLAVMAYSLAGFYNGRMMGRWQVATLLMAGCGLMGVGVLAQGGAPHWYLLIVAAIVGSVGGAIIDASLNSYVAVHFRPKFLNWLHACFGIGSTLGALVITQTLALNLTWRVGYGVIGGFAVVLICLFWLTRDQWIVNQTTANSEHVVVKSAETLRLPAVWLSIGVFVLYAAVEVSIGQWNYTLMTESRGVGIATAGVWASAYWGSLTVGRIVLGFIETNLVRLVRWSIVGTLLGTVLIWLNFSNNLNLLGLILAGFAQAPIFPALMALTPQRVGATHAPNAIGFQVAAAGLGIAIFPGLVGFSAENFGLETIPISFLILAIALLFLHEWLAKTD